MKKIFLTAFLVASAACVSAQNVQLHYDLGHTFYEDLAKRPSVTTTVELFKPDKWGSTYFFTDIDYFKDGVAGAYWEISREFNVSKNKQWAAHVEYDGGANTNRDQNAKAYGAAYYNACTGTRFQHAALIGPAWNWASKDFSKTFSVQLMYKYYFHGQNHARAFSGLQLTEVWGTTFANKLCTFSGFFDIWFDKSVDGNLIYLSEPQFWVNLGALKGWDGINLSVGTEVELSNNFVWDRHGKNNHFYAIPTIAAKWTF